MKTRSNFPIFFIGMPRSGTTIVFEAFARHPDLGWLTNYSDAHPNLAALNAIRWLQENRLLKIEGKKTPRIHKIGNRFLIRPDEAYGFWETHVGRDFSFDFMAGHQADQETAARVRTAILDIVRYQGRSRFSTKLTGPPRISFLTSIFPDARFVHVVRDGRAVTHSLLKVPFWKQKGGFDGPFWKGLPHEYEQIWEKDRDPGIITALQWRYVLELTDKERKGICSSQYMEVKYEDFVEKPHDSLNRLFRFCVLKNSANPHHYIDSTRKLENMNYKYRTDWSVEYIRKLTDCMEPILSTRGYS
ncbi:MAG: sulfotransferase family protein [Desulfobacterales bacterium]|jgi:hypothetical protein